MAEFPAFPLWTDAYLADTADLTTLEHGAYMLLLMAMWRAGGSLPDDEAKLRRVTRLDARQWPKVWPVIASLVVVDGGKVRSKRLTRELHAARARSEKAAASARSKHLKNNETIEADAEREQSSSSATTTITTDTPSSLRSEGVARDRRPNPIVVLQSEVDTVSAQRWVQHCAEKGKQPSSLQAEELCRILREVRSLGGSPADALRLGINKGWTSLNVEWLRNAGFTLKGTAPEAVLASWPIEKWRIVVDQWRARGDWNTELYGPKPGQPGCRVPTELLTRAA